MSPSNTPSVIGAENVVSGDQKVDIFGQNLDQVTAGAIYAGDVKVANLGSPSWETPPNPGDPGVLHMDINQPLTPGAYVMQLVYNGGIVGGQNQFLVVPPLGVDRVFDGTQQKVVVMSNGNDLGTDITFLRVKIRNNEGIVIQESTFDSAYMIQLSAMGR